VLEKNWILFQIAGRDVCVLGYDMSRELLIRNADQLSRFGLAATEGQSMFVLKSDIPRITSP
jgi:hypothetical protein